MREGDERHMKTSRTTKKFCRAREKKKGKGERRIEETSSIHMHMHVDMHAWVEEGEWGGQGGEDGE